jgi:serine/threonine protein kinase
LKKQKEYVRSELSGAVEVKDAYQDVLREIQIMKELDHICLIRIHEVINEKDGDKLYMSKVMFAENVVLDYAKYGQIMDWDTDTLKFTPCLKSKPQFTERDI